LIVDCITSEICCIYRGLIAEIILTGHSKSSPRTHSINRTQILISIIVLTAVQPLFLHEAPLLISPSSVEHTHQQLSYKKYSQPKDIAI